MATTSLSAFRALRPLSVIVTGGALLYVASDGGDTEVLRTRVQKLGTRLDESLVQTIGEERYAPVRNAFDTAISYVPEMTKSKPSQAAPEPEAVQNMGEDTTPQRGSAFCHTCSGPRLWYLADKFRIKRRIGPYPDPPRDDGQ